MFVREKVYFPQYNKIYVGLNDNNKNKVEGCRKGTRPILAGHPLQKTIITIMNNAVKGLMRAVNVIVRREDGTAGRSVDKH